METQIGGGRFEKTHWSVVLQAARDPADTCAREALARLYKTYWMPLYCFVRRQGKTQEEAEDLTQGFFVHLLENNAIARVKPGKGAFRTFLLHCLKNFVTNEWIKVHVQKRNPGLPILSFDAAESETHYRLVPVDRASPDRIYERDCAWALVEQAIGKLRAHYKVKGKFELFEALSPSLMGDRPDESYRELAKRFDMRVETLRVEASRMRKKLRSMLKELLQPMAGDEAGLEAEFRALLEALSL